MNKKPNKHITRQLLISAVVVALFVSVGVLLSGKAKSADTAAAPASSTDTVTVSPEGTKAADIRVDTVRTRTMQETIHTTGQVLYSSDLTVKISPRLAGRVKKVLVRVGDHVSAGETLAILDSVDAATARTTDSQNQNVLRQAKNNLDRAQRQFDLGTPEVTQAEAAVNSARTSALSAKDVLDKIKVQAQIGGFREKPVEDAENALVTAKSALSQAQSDVNLAQKDYNRKQQLVEIGVAAKADLEISEDTLEKAKTNLEAGQDTVKLAQKALDRERKAFDSNLYSDQQVNQAQFAYQQAQLQEQAAQRALLLSRAAIRTTLEQAKSDYQTAVFNVQNSKQQLGMLGQPGADGTFAIKAPISGVVTERFVAPGQVVDQSQMTPWQMFTLADTGRVWIEADVYEKDMSAVAEGAPVHIHVTALQNQEFDGTVLHIAPALDKSSRAIKVRADVDNALGKLKDGMYADVDILLPKGRQEVVIPLSAVEHNEDTDYVYVADNGRYVKRLVRLGRQQGGDTVVESGLRPGERFVTHGALFIGSDASGD